MSVCVFIRLSEAAWFLEELNTLDEEAVGNVISEVKEEMFTPEPPAAPDKKVQRQSIKQQVSGELPDHDGEVRDVEYYKTMLNELVDALDSAISHKVKLTQYIDKLLKKDASSSSSSSSSKRFWDWVFFKFSLSAKLQ